MTRAQVKDGRGLLQLFDPQKTGVLAFLEADVRMRHQALGESTQHEPWPFKTHFVPNG